MIEAIKTCLRAEAKALVDLSQTIDDNIIPFLDKLSQCEGKRCFTGVGKSLIIAGKIASSFSSIGYSSIEVDPLRLLHGDLGFLSKNDIIVAISNSGETEILLTAVRNAVQLGVEVISITSNSESTLAQMSSCHVQVKVDEAGAFRVIPSSSTTAVMALGDAILCGLIERDGVTIDSFRRLHPGGQLGRNL